MKKLILSLFVYLVVAGAAIAQDRTVTGTVTGKDDGLPIPGVSVKVKGTTNGVATGSDGKYSIRVTSGAVSLEFTSIGFVKQDVAVGSGTVHNVALSQDSQSLGEVVVTALGISKAKKTIGYAETTVKSEEINKSASVSLVGGLQGKIAGATISNTSGAPGGSTKVILRGFSSITGSNQPLYVIDGVPLDNSTSGSNSNYDFGNSANDVDPNNIESMSVLKGSAATALYGSRGSSGVILITTKKGKSGKLQVDFSTAATITQVAALYKPQDQFGQGWDATYIPSENGNWGPKFDGQMRSWGAVVDNQQLLKPYSFIKNNVRDALTNGLELNNNIAISGGNDNSTFYFAYGNINSNGYLPTDADSYKRNNVSLKGSTKYKNFSIDGSMNYVGKTQRFVSAGGGDSGIGSSFYEEILQIPSDIPISDFRNYKNKFFNVDNYFTPYAENPYYALYENGSRNKSDRVYGNVNMNYKVNDWLNIQMQQGADVSNSQTKIWHNKNAPTPGSYNDGGNIEGSKRAADVGNVIEQSFKTFEYDTKLNAIFNKQLSDKFDLDGLVGANYNDRGLRALSTSVEDLAIPGFYDISNSSNRPRSTEAESHRRLFGAYAQATLGYNKYLYLTVTARNDWSSTLATGQNSYFYPATSLAFLASEAFDLSKTPISFLKLRASYGQTGSDTNPYRINNILTATNIGLGYGNLQFPINGVPGFTVSNTLRSADLKPEKVSEVEFGGEIRFFNNRIGIDASYYNKIRKDQVLAVPIDPASGYTSSFLNFGKVRNRGVEVALNAKPVLSKDFQWNLNYTFSRERNMVLELPAGLEKVIINSAYDAQFVAEVGKPLGTIQAPVATYDPQGRIIVDNTGFPVVASANGDYGSMQRDFSMGLTNSFTYKNFALGFTLDWQKGGVFYSGTADLLNFVGADEKTTWNDRKPFVVPNSVQRVLDAAGNATYVENSTVISEGQVDDYYYPTTNKGLAYNNRILSKSFLKLREVTLSYTLPKLITGKILAQRATFSVFGRNLVTWLPSSNKTIDPEVSNYGNDLTSEFGEFRTAPPVRFFGAALKVTF